MNPPAAFDASRPFTSFPPPPRRRARRRSSPVLFVAQDEARFVVKAFADADAMERELAGIASFERAGAAATAAVSGPYDRVTLTVDDSAEALRHVLVYAYRDRPVLQDKIADADDPASLIAEAATQMRARHDAAEGLSAVHSDGSAHNVFDDFVWFDFAEPHAAVELDAAKAHEVHRFVQSVVEVSPAGTEARRARLFCEAYGDARVLALARQRAQPGGALPRVRMWLRRTLRPDKRRALAAGDTTVFRRIRTWRALEDAHRAR